MTRISGALALAALVAAAEPAAAEEKQATVGVGVGFTALDLVALEAAAAYRTSFCVPINVGAFRIEPEFAGWTSDQAGGATTDRPSLGVGLLYRVKQVEATRFYAGGRFGFSSYRSVTSGQPAKTSTNFRLAAVAAGEHFVGPAFSVGGEAQIGYVHVGEVKQDGTVIEKDASVRQTAGVIFLRFYFM